jgi:hypothetical protein
VPVAGTEGFEDGVFAPGGIFCGVVRRVVERRSGVPDAQDPKPTDGMSIVLPPGAFIGKVLGRDMSVWC